MDEFKGMHRSLRAWALGNGLMQADDKPDQSGMVGAFVALGLAGLFAGGGAILFALEGKTLVDMDAVKSMQAPSMSMPKIDMPQMSMPQMPKAVAAAPRSTFNTPGP